MRGTAAELPRAGEYEIKAAFLYNFAKFAEWPPETLPPGSPLIIAVLGQDPFGPALDATTADQEVNGHPLVVKRLSDPREIAPCHILFVSASETAVLKRLQPWLAERGVLTVSDISDFARMGGVIQFVTRNNKVHFQINVEAAEQSGIRLSSQLLKLAEIVSGGGTPSRQ